MKGELLKKIISNYVSSLNIDPEMKAQVEFNLFKDIQEEFKNEEIEKLRLVVRREQENEDSIKRKKKVKIVLIEVVFTALLVGLLVNQITEFLSFLKGQVDPAWFNVCATFLVAVVCIAVIALLIYLSYFVRIERRFEPKGEK